MSVQRIASRYAKSLLDLAIERNELDTVYADMTLLGASIHASRELHLLLKSPIVKTDNKRNALVELFGNSLSEVVKGFMLLLVHKRREMYLEDVCDAFQAAYLEHKGIAKANLVLSTELSAELVEKVRQLLSAQTGKNIELNVSVNADLISGYLLTIGDRRLDASVARQLKEIKQELIAS